MLLLIFLAVSVIFFYLKLIKPLSYWHNRKIQHAKSWPFIGSMGPPIFRLTSFPEWIQDLYCKYPDSYVGILQFLTPTLVVTDIEIIKKITVKDFDHFLDHTMFVSEDVDPLFGKSLFVIKGQRWRNLRTTLSPAFTGSKMRAMFVLMSECAEDFTSYFLKDADPNSPKTLEMTDIFTRFANDVVASAVFGIKCDSLKEKNNEFYLTGKKASDFNGIRGLKFFGSSISPFLMKLFRVRLCEDDTTSFFRNVVKTNIATREKEGLIRPDMIHLLMETRKGQLKYDESSRSDKEAGFATVEEEEEALNRKEDKTLALTDDDIAAQALGFFLASFISIATLLSHMAHELAVNTDIQRKLQEEIDAALLETNGKVTYEMLTQMKYLDMIVSETLRKWPPSFFGDRICTKTCMIKPTNPFVKPIVLQKNDIIWIPTYAIHRDPKYFPDPDKFIPERFSDENKKNIKPFTYMPFGIGPRNCIGSRFALLEAKVVFVHLLSKFNLVVVEKTQVPLRLTRKSAFLVGENGFWLGLKLRSNF